MSLRWKFAIKFILATILVALTMALFASFMAIIKVRQGKLSAARHWSMIANTVISPTSKLTAHQIPELEVWHQSLMLIQLLEPAAARLHTNLQSLLSISSDSTTNIWAELEPMTTLIEEIGFNWHRSALLTRLPQTEVIDQVVRLNVDVKTIVSHISQEKFTLLVLLQNNHELRATGGFMGSYLLATWENGQLTDLTIQDIYEPDGQFQGYVEAPPGVKEYLSSGHGLRLPDANWHPDFPTSCQQILTFFALGKKQSIDAVAAINLSVVEKMMAVLGEVYLPDYQTSVTAANLAEVARADRSEFFPGSQQKPQFLSALFTQLKLLSVKLTTDQYYQLIKLLRSGINSKDIQLFAIDPVLETIITNYGMGGQLAQTTESDYLYLVESNVGINKANSKITRQVQINQDDYRSLITIQFDNQHPVHSPPTMDYANYQRLIIPPEYLVKSITYQGQPLSNWDTHQISNYQLKPWQQIGWLITVPEGKTTTMVVELTHPRLKSQLTIQKQPGLPPTPYAVTRHQQTQSWLLESDVLVNF